ncbi:hypothetical protein C9374_013998 [Naegleria lovaniensis]|uniref:DH domain-containing protein n=1 Tax=Naegleria lovaniensis TaxID=51637 RepID=A0AA88KPG8_NAELO|nr:uncharacterized protein C9374_013998 [Naegleria lovaniensis]KAG2389438.1 hypothetical protein C9374_013998 [Naegleria lovaniensis]
MDSQQCVVDTQPEDQHDCHGSHTARTTTTSTTPPPPTIIMNDSQEELLSTSRVSSEHSSTILHNDESTNNNNNNNNNTLMVPSPSIIPPLPPHHQQQQQLNDVTSSPLPFTSHRNDIAGDEHLKKNIHVFSEHVRSSLTIDQSLDYKELYLKELEKNKIMQVQLNIMQMERQDEMSIIHEIENDGRNLHGSIKKLKQIHMSNGTHQAILENIKRNEFLLFENEMNQMFEQPLQELVQRIHTLEKELNSMKIQQPFNGNVTSCAKCLELQNKSATIIQKAFRSYRLKKRMKLLLPQYDIITQRNSLISEIVHTEETYVKSLTLIQRLYIDPLKNADSDAKRFNVTMLDIQNIFNNLSTILSMHKIFLMTLKQRLEQWPKVYIGESFLNQSFFFLFYVEYVNGYNQSSNTLRELRQKNREFHSFLNETKKNKECKGLSLESYLILPIQRLPRYKLLLKGVLKNTLPDHNDYANLKSAYRRISAVNAAINSKKKEHESYSIINKIFNEMKIFSVEQDYHYVKHKLLKVDVAESYESKLKTFFIREGFANYVATDIQKPKKIQCFLFDKFLILVAIEKKMFVTNPIYRYLHTLTFSEASYISQEKGEKIFSQKQLDPELDYLFIEQDNVTHAISFEKESLIANTHQDWAKKIYKYLHKTEQDESAANEKQKEMIEVLKICDAMFHHKFSSATSSFTKLDSPFEETKTLIRTFSFLSKKGSSSASSSSSSISPVKNDDDESEVKKFLDNISVNSSHF